MRAIRAGVAAAIGISGLTCASAWADPKVEEQVVGTIGAPQTQYLISDMGAHLATIGSKGSRMVVTFDGTAGPKIDQVLTPEASWVDLRQMAGNIKGAPVGVAFSRDGSHHGYIARSGSDCVVIVDGKEQFKVPSAPNAPAFNGTYRCQFSGPTGNHFLVGHQAFSGWELFVDGAKWPGYYTSGTDGLNNHLDPLISADGEQIGYAATLEGDKKTVIINGKDMGVVTEQIAFTPDSKHVVCVGTVGKEQVLLVDGKSLFKAGGIRRYWMSAVGNRIIACLVHQGAEGGVFLLVDGKPADQSKCFDVLNLVFSPDGKRYAAVCKSPIALNTDFVVIDGKKGQEYTEVVPKSLRFSADSKKVGYVATSHGKQFVVLDEDESDEFTSSADFAFSGDGSHAAYSGMLAGPKLNLPLFIDGKPVKTEVMPMFGSFAFSADGSHYGFFGGTNDKGGPVCVDGKATGLTGLFLLSPDGKHVAVAGYRDSDQQWGMYLDGKLLNPLHANHWSFSPDGQHLCWSAFEPSKDPANKPGHYITFVDGKQAASFENQPMFGGGEAEHRWLQQPDGQGRIVNGISPSWQFAADGTLLVLGPVENSVKRFKITMPSDTGIATMLGK